MGVAFNVAVACNTFGAPMSLAEQLDLSPIHRKQHSEIERATHTS
jgi:hypothetical protein